MNKTTLLWTRMMKAARNAAARHGWRAAARIRRDWTEWYYRQLSGPKVQEPSELTIR